MIERILCAAIWYRFKPPFLTTGNATPVNIEQGYVLCGFRHSYIISTHLQLMDQPTRRETSTQGFLTNKNRFVNRIEGMKIAIAAGQVKDCEEGDELISEYLY